MRATLTTARLRQLLAMAAVLATFVLAAGIAGCGDDDSGGGGGDSSSTTDDGSGGSGGGGTDTSGGGTPQSASTREGAQIFQDVGCESCHTLKAAGAAGTVGPNLDQVKPTLPRTIEQVSNGGGAMPAYKDRLSRQQIEAVSQYVVTSTGGG